MKRILIALCVLLFLFCFSAQTDLNAQVNRGNINQKELFKKWFTGTWKCEVAKDTFYTFVAIPFGSGFDCFARQETKGEIFSEIKSLIGYDSKKDIYYQVEIFKDSDIAIFELRFVNDNLCVIEPVNEKSNSENYSNRMELEFLSPIRCQMTFYKNSKAVKTEEYFREGTRNN